MRSTGWLFVLGGCGSLTYFEPPEPECATEVTSFADVDGDGFGDPETATVACAVEDGAVTVDGDCDDGDPDRYPDAAERCDGLDDDCDEVVDDGLSQHEYHLDADGDGFGDPNTVVTACAAPPDAVEDATDCDDGDAAAAPGLAEVCDGADNDCDGSVDDDDSSVDPGSFTAWYRDADGDGFGVGTPIPHCEGAGQYTATADGDCDDADALVSPGATEVCGGGDEDCDGAIDDADPSVDAADFSTWYADTDRDGLGDPGAARQACAAAGREVANDDDCDDGDAAITAPIEWTTDADGDGLGDGVSLGPSCPPGAPGTAPAADGVDCDDGNALVYPGNDEDCGDGLDNDCVGGDDACGPTGSFAVYDGPDWHTNPPVYSCIEACALLFGGAASDWSCSTSATVETGTAYVSGYGDASHCSSPVAEGFSLEQAAPGYSCGMVGCAYSAFVRDNCGPTVTNWCWPR